MQKTFNGFESLDVYKSARAFRIKISQLVKQFPSDEKYLLRSQIIRSSRSIAANIAEGYGRFYYKEFIQFCRQARGSLTETLEHLICAFNEGYINQQQLNLIKVDYQNVLRLINGFINYLLKQSELQAKEKHFHTTNSTITTNTTNNNV